MGKCRFIIFVAVAFITMDMEARICNDTIVREHNLQEVVVLAPTMERMKDYILVRLDANQRKHANNAYELLYNCFIPGVKVNAQSGSVEAMGSQTSLYINGQPCDSRDLLMLRSRDIEKIEYHDVPNGKYANTRTAINFVMKQYRYGGYVLAKAQQTIGYNQGVYDVATTLDHGRDTYSFFAGISYSDICGNKAITEEYFNFDTPITRLKEQQTSYRQNGQYVQLRYQHNGKSNYLTTKLTFVNSDMPYNRINGMAKVTDFDNQTFWGETSQNGVSPKFDLTGEYRFNDKNLLNYGAHFTYNRNKYNRSYEDGDFKSITNAVEDAFSFKIACIYNVTMTKGTFTAEMFHYHNIWNSNYTGDAPLWQHLWKGESLAFVTYNRQLSPRLSLFSRLGVDWLQYHLHNSNTMTQMTPRVNLRLQYQIPQGNLLYSANYVNSNYGNNVINDAEITVDRYLSMKGNPNLKKSYDFNTYGYYVQQFKNRFTLTAFSQYNYSHNYVTTNYTRQGDRILCSYNNDGDTHSFSEIAGLTYRPLQNLIIGGDIRYSHLWLNAVNDKHVNCLTGNINVALYWRNFSIQPMVCFGQKSLDFASMHISEVPFNYSFRFSYANKGLNIAAYVASPFNRLHTNTIMETPIYSKCCEISNRTQSQYCNLTLSYTFDFGRKTNIIDSEIDKATNSSLLQVN